MLGAAAVLGYLVIVAPAFAVLEGTNGRIALISGREGGDSQAKLYLRTTIGGTGGGSLGPALTTMTGVQHRHPTWSPDRTAIAYARGTPGSPTTEMFDIFIHNLVTGAITPITSTTDNLSSDRPAWSPDGTRISWEQQPAAASADRHLVVHTLAGGGSIDLTAPGAPIEGKPAWSPDSQTIYYSSGDPAVNADIVSEPAGGGTPAPAIPDSSISEFQPSVSPDGQRICFTLGTGFNGTADVVVAPLATPASQTILSSDNVGTQAEHGDYNCTWSPDGTRIAYVRGTFGSGALVVERGDGSDLTPLELTNQPGVFDGNPDWAPDGRPECPDLTVETDHNTAVTVPLSCVDTGPDYEHTPVLESIPGDGHPDRGLLDPVVPGEPSTVTYTPVANFSGTDSFQYIGRDDFAFGSDRGTVTVNVAEPDDPGPGNDEDPPGLTLSGKKKQRAGKFIRVAGRCDEDCTIAVGGKLVVRGRGATKRYKLRPVRREAGANQKAALRVKLPSKARKAAAKALAGGGKAVARLRASATDGAGNATKAKRTVRLKRR